MAKRPILTTSSTDGTILNIAGGSYRIIISGEQTDGAFAVIEMTVPPGAGPNPHAHPGFTETFYVLEGDVSFVSEDGSYLAEQGAYVTIPKGGIIHGFKNKKDFPAKLLCTVFPAGLEGFFSEVGALDMMAENRMEQVKEISERYGQTLYPEGYLDLK